MKRVSVFLIVVALILGVVACEGEGEPKWELVMAVNPAGSGTAIDLTDASPYTGGTVVRIKAEATVGYEFSHWSVSAEGEDVSLYLQSAMSLESSIELPLDEPAQTIIVTANFVLVYDLIITSTTGGNVTSPGEGTFTYDANTVVTLNAATDSGYHFSKWTGDVSTVADANAATTYITMNSDYSITANFAPGIPLWDWNDLDAIRDNLGRNYTLMNDLDSTTVGYEELASPTANEGKGWQPIGTVSIPIESPYDFLGFTGTLDGQGYEIFDLFINRPDENSVGLFGAVNIEGVIKDIGVVNATVIGELCVGSLVAGNAGNITTCCAAVTVSGDAGAGGLVGINFFGTVSNSYATGSVTGEEYSGGLVGYNRAGTVSNSYGTGSVTGIEGVGGLVGVNQDVSMAAVTVSNSYSSGSVTGVEWVGGLVGYNGGHVSNSYSTGNVIAEYAVGGLVGWFAAGTISKSYSTGSVTGSTFVGGLVGFGYFSGSTVYDSFWDTETSGQSTSGGGTGKTTAEMQDITTFTDTETEGLDDPWDIVEVINSSTHNNSYIWNIVDDETYPFFSW